MKPRQHLDRGELHGEPYGLSARSVAIPFIIFTAIWGSTWIVIRSQLGTVPPQWSVTYRFIIAALAMAAPATTANRHRMLFVKMFMANKYQCPCSK